MMKVSSSFATSVLAFVRARFMCTVCTRYFARQRDEALVPK